MSRQRASKWLVVAMVFVGLIVAVVSQHFRRYEPPATQTTEP